MASTPDRPPVTWPDPGAPAAPSRPAGVRPIGGRVPRFGVADELDRAQRGVAPPAPSRSASARPTSRGDGGGHGLRTWWASRDTRPTDVWHRLRCRSGHHDVQGGQRVQLGGRYVNLERCCVWCGAKPPP
ncbi:MAG: hypothetical protein ABR511_01460 [Acidimicrobiales bacterium]